jgi:TonB family protein
MKNVISFCALVCTLALLVSCNSKEKERAKAKADSLAYAASQDSIKRIERDEKRQLLANARAEKMEQRRLAWEEQAKTAPTYKDASGKTVYRKSEVNPSYPGGDAEMIKYFNDNIKYPQEALDKGVEGTVFVEFVVDSKGKVRDAVATDFVGETADPLLKDEALRLVTSMPAWVAGTYKGKNVDSYYSVPVTFEILN